MKKVFCVFLLALPLLGSGLIAGNQPDLIAVKFHADWCGSCKKMGNVFSDLNNKFDGKSVLFVELDKTNMTTSHQAKMLASALGLEAIYEQNKGTGFILILDARTKAVKAKLTASDGIKDMTKEILNHLS